MKLSPDLRLGRDVASPGFLPRLYEAWRDLIFKVNGLAAGDPSALDETTTTMPSGNHAQGKFIRNSAPTELGSAGSKYVILGWICVTGGPSATFRECRTLTGN